MAGLPILAVSGLVGYFLARRLLRPVERTFASQEQFLQDASHEMRNPLAALSAVIQEASSTNDPATQQQALARLSRQTHQLIKLNESLLTLERAKIPQANVALVNASELVLDTADSLNPEASSRSIRLALNVAPDVHVAMTNHDFVCIVRNLIHNAIKYSPDTSDVAINLRLDKQQAVLSIEDHGIGIPAHELARVGERFYRGTNVGRTRGTGLGLAIVQQIAQANRVGFKVSSREHLGTRVTLVFTNKGSTQR